MAGPVHPVDVARPSFWAVWRNLQETFGVESLQVAADELEPARRSAGRQSEGC
jgi:hypothetical protein